MRITIEMPDALYERLEIQRKRWLEIMGKGFATAEELILAAVETAVEQSENDENDDPSCQTPEEQDARWENELKQSLIDFCKREDIAELLKS